MRPSVLRVGIACAVTVLVACAPPPSPINATAPATGSEQAACFDFYSFANADWLARTAIPDDRSEWNATTEIEARNDLILRRILETAAPDLPSSGVEGRVRTLYASAMDTLRIAALGAAPLDPHLAEIDAVRSSADILEVVARHQAAGTPLLFQLIVDADLHDSSRTLLYVLQGGLGLTDRQFYLREDSTSRQLRDDYREHVARLMHLAVGGSRAGALTQADRVLEIETRLAHASLDAEALRDPAQLYRLVTPAEAEEETPNLRWSTFFRVASLPDGPYSHPHRAFFRELDRMLAELPLEHWRSYLRYHLIRDAAPYLSSTFETEHFDFFGTRLEGIPEMQPRWVRARNAVERVLGEEIGRLYVREAFPPEARARVLAITERLRSAMEDRIRSAEWMSPATREEALGKLATLDVKIGHPDRWQDSSELALNRGTYFENMRRARALQTQRDFARIGQPVDRTRWGMPPQAVNAYYNPLANEVVFPAGILQPPFFDEAADDAANYGAIGAIIGHEIVHAFDDLGSQFDASGAMRDWWAPGDRAEFEERASRMATQYSEFFVVDTIRVNGELSLGESIADLGGLELALHAMRLASPSGAPNADEERRFFLAFARSWRSLEREEALRARAFGEAHPPPRVRVTGVIRNMSSFAEAFACQPGDPMVGDSSSRVSIW